MVEGNAKRASVAWRSVSTSTSTPSAWSCGSDVSTCGKAKGEEEDDGEEGDGREARGHMSSSPGGVVVVGGTGWSVQDQLVENGVCDDGGGSAWASHSDSAWRDIASRRCLRMRAAARADEGKVGVSGEDEDEEEDSEEKELEDIVWRVGRLVVREEMVVF